MIIFWIIGSVISYYLIKMKFGKEIWTIGDMVFAIVFSMLFWYAILLTYLFSWVVELDFWNRPSKW